MPEAQYLAKRKVSKAAVGTVIAGFVSVAHHWYGAFAYDTPWRLVVSLWIPGFVAIAIISLYLYWTRPTTKVGFIAFWIFFLSAVVFQAGFTMFECVYSHVVKDVLYFVGAPQDFLLRLFPPPAYHLPDDFLFELSGLLQFVGLIAAWWALQVVRDRKVARER